MTIIYKLDEQGGFTCGDTDTTLTSYAYPTSPWADESKKAPEKIAKAMLDEQEWRKQIGSGKIRIRDYDKRNWQRLEFTPYDGFVDGTDKPAA